MFFRRDRTGPDRWLEAKIALFTLGAVLALVGMVFDNDWLIMAAVLVLALGLVLRALSRRGASTDRADEGPG